MLDGTSGPVLEFRGLFEQFLRPARRGGIALSRAASFDHLVGAGEQRWRHIKAEHIGGLAPVLLLWP